MAGPRENEGSLPPGRPGDGRAIEDVERTLESPCGAGDASAVRLEISQRILDAHEGERRRIARQLHDGIAQDLTAVTIRLERVRARMSDDQSRMHIDWVLERIGDAARSVRELARDLRPSILDDLGLIPALRSNLDQRAAEVGLVAYFSVQVGEETRFEPEVETACYRIAQEALANAIRHAQARQVWLSVQQQGVWLVLTVRDDGVGFDPQALRTGSGLGVCIMRERARLLAGRLEIRSSPGQGTEIRALLPACERTPQPDE
jgi:signal transduction histidine kinase